MASVDAGGSGVDQIIYRDGFEQADRLYQESCLPLAEKLRMEFLISLVSSLRIAKFRIAGFAAGLVLAYASGHFEVAAQRPAEERPQSI